MGRCSGCGADRCGCVIQEGANISITGAGTTENPLVISSEGSAGASLPTGSIIMFGAMAEPSPPAGWLVCDGKTVPRAVYADLFSVIGTIYGVGDGTSTFTLPDLAGTFPLGRDGGHALGTPAPAQAGAETITLTEAQLPAHSHVMTHNHADVNSGNVSADHTHSGATGDMSANHSHGVNIQSGGQSAQHSHGITIQSIQARVDGGQFTMQSGGGTNTGNASSDHSHNVAGGTDWANAGHAHNFTTGGISANHSHLVSTPTFTGNTGAAGTGAAVKIMPPWTGVTFLIKT